MTRASPIVLNIMALLMLTASAAAQETAQPTDGLSGPVNGRVNEMLQGLERKAGQNQTGTAQNGGPTLGTVPEPITPAPVLPVNPRFSPLINPGAPKTPVVVPPATGGLGMGSWRR